MGLIQKPMETLSVSGFQALVSIWVGSATIHVFGFVFVVLNRGRKDSLICIDSGELMLASLEYGELQHNN